MGKKFKKTLALVLCLLFVIGLYACSSKVDTAATTKNNTNTKKYTKEEAAELQKSPEKLMRAYYDLKILMGQSDTPDRTVIGKFYNLLTVAGDFPLSYNSEDDFASQLTGNLKNFYKENGKLLDAKIDAPVMKEDGSEDISVTEHYEKQDLPCTYKFVKKDGLWYMSY